MIDVKKNRLTCYLISCGIFWLPSCGQTEPQHETYRKPFNQTSQNDDANQDNSDKEEQNYRFSFLNPSAQNVITDKTFVIKIITTITVPNTTWNLYYTKNINDLKSGTLISKDLDIKTTEVTWNTATITEGVYFFYAILKINDQHFAATSTGSVKIQHQTTQDPAPPAPPDPQIPNQPPTVNLTTLDGGTTVIAGQVVEIKYDITDPDTADLEKMTYTIELSQDSGKTWTALTTNHKAKSYMWSVPATQKEDITYRVRVKADDTRGGTAIDSSQNDFGIATTEITYTNTVGQTITTNCSGAACHTNGAGGFNSGSYDNNVFAKRTDILRVIKLPTNDPKFMPRGRQPLPQPTINKIQLWIWGGGKN